MCGRATLTAPAEDIAAIFEAEPITIGPPRYNIAPTQPVVTVRRAAGETRRLATARWGLIPWWAKPDEARRIGGRCVQARAESVRTSPAFRDAFNGRRCLVVFDGFYEWSDGPPQGRSKKPTRVPHLVRRPDGEPLAIAGVWDCWTNDELATTIASCAVLTTRSAGNVASIHDRMPLVLPANDWDCWLAADAEAAAALLSPSEEARERRACQLVIRRVSTWVNDVKHDDERCIEPADATGGSIAP